MGFLLLYCLGCLLSRDWYAFAGIFWNMPIVLVFMGGFVKILVSGGWPDSYHSSGPGRVVGAFPGYFLFWDLGYGC